MSYVRSKREIALCCASSGIAASLYPGGRTAHNLFRIDVQDDADQERDISCSVSPNSQRAELLRSAKVIVWDEFVMTHRKNFEAVNFMLKTIRQNSSEPCGGVIFIGAGDFRQIPPVVTNGSKWDIIQASVKRSSIWKIFQQHRLMRSMRQADDPQYAK